MKLFNFSKTKTPEKDLAKCSLVPWRFSSYIYDMNYVFANTDSDVIVGREKEINKIYDIFLKTRRENAMIVGEHGVGKSALVQGLVNNVIHKRCPKEFLNYHFWFLDIMAIQSMLDMDYKKGFKILETMIEFIAKYNNIVIVIDRVHMAMYDKALIDFFTRLINIDNCKVIGLSTPDEFYSTFQYDTHLYSRFNIIELEEPKYDEIPKMIHKVIAKLPSRYKVSITREMIEYGIDVSTVLWMERANPGFTVDFIENAMISAKRKNRKEVTRKDFKYAANINYKMYKKMSKEDKKATAYHEAGHYLMIKMSKTIKNIKTRAVTIVPAEGYLGLTSFDLEYEKQTFNDKSYYISMIAMDLAGREAEKIFFESEEHLTTGASSDLEHATKLARSFAAEWGSTNNIAYLGSDSYTNLALLSDKIRNKINSDAENIIKEAAKLAKETLNEHKELLAIIAEELLKNEILVEKDLNNICNKYFIKNKIKDYKEYKN